MPARRQPQNIPTYAVKYTTISQKNHADRQYIAPDFLTLALHESWRDAYDWALSHNVLQEWLLVLNTTQIRNNPNIFGCFLSIIKLPDSLYLLEEWAQAEKPAQYLKSLADAAIETPTIFDSYDPFFSLKSSAKEFRGALPIQYLLALLLERIPFEKSIEYDWIIKLKLWVLTHAVDRAISGNIKDRNLRKVSDQLRLSCDSDKDFLKFVLELRTSSIDFDEIGRHFVSKSELLHKRKPTPSQKKFLSSLVKVAQYIHSQDLNTSQCLLLPTSLPDSRGNTVETLHYEPTLLEGRENEDSSIGNVEWITPDNEDESAPLVLLSVDDKQSFTHQHLHANSILLYSQEDLQYLPWTWNQANQFEIEQLHQWIKTTNQYSKNPQERLFVTLIWIALATSRTFKRTLDIKFTDEIIPEWTINLDFTVLKRQSPQRVPGWNPGSEIEKKWTTPVASGTSVTLPTEIVRAIKKSVSGKSPPTNLRSLWDPNWGATPEAQLQELLNHIVPRLTPGMLAGILPQQIFQSGGDATFARMMSSHPNSALPGACAYASWSVSQVNEAMGNTGNIAHFKLKEAANHTALGSRLCPIELLLVRSIRRAISTLTSLRKGYDIIAFHNAYTSYITVALLAATGARPIKDPFESISHFDLNHCFVYISDKVSGNLRQGRIVRLPDMVCQLIKDYYLPHLECMSNVFQDVNPTLAGEMRKMSQGIASISMPFLFLLSNKKNVWRSVSETAIQELDLFEWPLPLNLFRHRLSQKLRHRGVDPEVVDSILGHAETGTATHGDFSFRTWNEDMAAAMPVVRQAFDDLGFEQSSGWNKSAPRIYPVNSDDKWESHSELALYGSKAREHNRKIRFFATIRDARFQIGQFVGARELNDLDPDEIYELSRRLLFKKDGLPHPSGFIKYQYLIRKIERLWKEKGKKVRLSKRFLPSSDERSIFTEGAPNALSVFDEIKADIFGLQPISKSSKANARDSAVIASVLLCIENQISSKALLHDVNAGRNFRLVTLKGHVYIEYSKYLTSENVDIPTQRYRISSRTASFLNRVLGTKIQFPATRSIPSALMSITKKMERAGRVNHAPCSDDLLNSLSELIDQVNAITMPGILAGYLAGRVKSFSLMWRDWTRLELGYAVQTPNSIELGSNMFDEASQVVSKVSAFATITKLHELEKINVQENSRLFLRKIDSYLSTFHSDPAEFIRTIRTKDASTEETVPKSDSKRIDNRKAERKDLARKLEELIQDSSGQVSTANVLLAKWVCSLLFRRGRDGFINVNSIRRYLGALSPSFLEIGYSADILKMDEEDMTIFYTEILESLTVEDTKYVADRLVDFHRWAKREYAVEDPDWLDLPETFSGDHVLPGVITEKEYQDALQLLLNVKEKNTRFRLAPAFLLLCCYRFGLRGGEALRLMRSEWISYPGMTVVLVRNNKYRKLNKLKTPTSRRQIPLVFSLSKSETELIDQWLAHAESVHGADMSAPLFFDELSNHELLNEGDIKRKAIAALKIITNNPLINLHHARHSAANRVGTGIAQLELSIWNRLNEGHENQQSVNIEKILLGRNGQTRRKSWAISRYLGHVRSDTTFKNYLHFMGEWADSVLAINTGDAENIPLNNAVVLDNFPKLAPVSTDLLATFSSTMVDSIPSEFLKFMRLVARGKLGHDAGAALSFDPILTDRCMVLLTTVNEQIRLAPNKASTSSAMTESTFQLLNRLKEPAWNRLIGFAIATKRRESKIVKSAPPLSMGGFTQMIGANRQILMWNEDHFSFVRFMLDCFGIDDTRYKVVRPSQLNDRVLGFARQYRFKPACQKSKTGKPINLDAGFEGENKNRVENRCAFLLHESNDFSIRNNVEMIVIFLAFAMCALHFEPASHNDSKLANRFESFGITE